MERGEFCYLVGEKKKSFDECYLKEINST